MVNFKRDFSRLIHNSTSKTHKQWNQIKRFFPFVEKSLQTSWKSKGCWWRRYWKFDFWFVLWRIFNSIQRIFHWSIVQISWKKIRDNFWYSNSACISLKDQQHFNGFCFLNFQWGFWRPSEKSNFRAARNIEASIESQYLQPQAREQLKLLQDDLSVSGLQRCNCKPISAILGN